MRLGKRERELSSNLLISFRCGPCKVLEPRLEKVLTNYNKSAQDASQVQLAKVDIDNLGELSSKYNVQAVPTGENF